MSFISYYETVFFSLNSLDLNSFKIYVLLRYKANIVMRKKMWTIEAKQCRSRDPRFAFKSLLSYLYINYVVLHFISFRLWTWTSQCGQYQIWIWGWYVWLNKLVKVEIMSFQNCLCFTYAPRWHSISYYISWFYHCVWANTIWIYFNVKLDNYQSNGDCFMK